MKCLFLYLGQVDVYVLLYAPFLFFVFFTTHVWIWLSGHHRTYVSMILDPLNICKSHLRVKTCAAGWASVENRLRTCGAVILGADSHMHGKQPRGKWHIRPLKGQCVCTTIVYMMRLVAYFLKREKCVCLWWRAYEKLYARRPLVYLCQSSVIRSSIAFWIH